MANIYARRREVDEEAELGLSFPSSRSPAPSQSPSDYGGAATQSSSPSTNIWSTRSGKDKSKEL